MPDATAPTLTATALTAGDPAVDWQRWVFAALAVGAAVAAALLAHAVVQAAAAVLARRSRSVLLTSTLKRSMGPTRLLFPVVAAQLVLPSLDLPGRAEEIARQLAGILLIVGVTWLAVRLTRVADDVVGARYPVGVPDNRRARKIATLVQIGRQIAVTVLVVLGVAMAIMTFPQARQVGASILASAGIAGIIVGIAAQGTLRNLLAGLQVALTEPIVLDDVVIVDGEFCRVEEITQTYVVLRVWDNRRIIAPISRFIEESFENWTRTTTALLGTVFLHVDYAVPVAAVRAELDRLLAGDARFDGQAKGLVVTEAKDGRLELRATVSAANSGDLFDLRCAVREGLVAFLQREHPGALYKTRVELLPGRDGPADPARGVPRDARTSLPHRPAAPDAPEPVTGVLAGDALLHDHRAGAGHPGHPPRPAPPPTA